MDNPARIAPSMYDLIVVGAGGMGAAAAYHLAHRGRRILLLEQFQIGNKQGSSHGGSRIFRYAHDTTEYAKFMPQTYELWRELEQRSGTDLLKITGSLFAAHPDSSYLARCCDALEALGFPYELFSGASLSAAYPQLRVPETWIGLVQPDAGILSATKCVQTFAEEAVKHGATLLENTRVLAVAPSADGVEVSALSNGTQQTFRAEQVILAVGPWAPAFLSALLPEPIPLRVTHQQVAYFAVERPDDFSPDRFPVFILDLEPHCYGFPIWEQPGAVKIALEQSETTVDPEQERQLDQALLRDLVDCVKTYFPTIIPEPISAEPCLYTETHNRDFIIDRHPHYPQILFAAGFSGRGFKHTIAIGRLLADLADSPSGVYDSPFWLDRYRIDRFLTNAAPGGQQP